MISDWYLAVGWRHEVDDAKRNKSDNLALVGRLRSRGKGNRDDY